MDKDVEIIRLAGLIRFAVFELSKTGFMSMGDNSAFSLIMEHATSAASGDMQEAANLVALALQACLRTCDATIDDDDPGLQSVNAAIERADVYGTALLGIGLLHRLNKEALAA